MAKPEGEARSGERSFTLDFWAVKGLRMILYGLDYHKIIMKMLSYSSTFFDTGFSVFYKSTQKAHDIRKTLLWRRFNIVSTSIKHRPDVVCLMYTLLMKQSIEGAFKERRFYKAFDNFNHKNLLEVRFIHSFCKNFL